jgi:hypothetical protein
MDAKRMKLEALTPFVLAAYLAAGVFAGALYFLCVWWNAHLFATGSRAGLTILLILGRLAVLGCALAAAAHAGAMPLLLMALGVFLARFAVMRGLRATAP